MILMDGFSTELLSQDMIQSWRSVSDLRRKDKGTSHIGDLRKDHARWRSLR